MKVIYLFRLQKYLSKFTLVGEEHFEESVKVFKSNLDDEYFQTQKVPVKFKEINDVYGKCFYLYTAEYATIEQQFQGSS